ncbi:MAG: efflux RND transporter periplasmic adaptor subunit [Candidatus Omnitrophica bacterium]|nr:efflux RND transporter periplasmic adaptor subunit [Candidatus Omnitrophota bacterium]MDD5660271.1 efflux RND transporter periplasmic adaptor subunit [Candidatus Omnitrophota bacterium]
MGKKLNLVVLVIAVFIAGAIFAVYFFQKENHNKVIKVSGNIEGDDVRISFRVDGQITELLTDEGKVVKKGEIVARLNTDELVKERDNAAALLKAAQFDYELAKIDYQRSDNLFKEGAVSAQKRDQDKTKYDASLAKVEQLKASLDLAQTRLDFTELASPLDGYILIKSSLAGEVIKPGTPVFTAVDLHNIWVTAYINEKDLGRVKLGQNADVVTDTYAGKKYKGTVSFVSSQAEFTPKFIQTQEERVKLVYRIKVRVDNSSLELKPGMPADAYIIE